MLFNKTNNKFAINSYNILLEICIAFSVFAIFFGVFMSYYFISYETNLLSNFITKSVSFYKFDDILLSDNTQIKPIINNLITNNIGIDKKKLEEEVRNNESVVSEHNKEYDNKLIKIIIMMISALLLLLIIPLLLGFIRLEQILPFKYICLSLLLHIILIVGFELLFFYYILIYINPVKLYLIFQANKIKTGRYI